MKKIVLFLSVALLAAAAGCKKETAGDDSIPENSPRTEVPASMLTPEGKYWTIGTVSSIYFHDPSSPDYYNYYKNGGGVVVFFKFKPGGLFESLVYVVVNSYGTETETWTSVEGTVEFVTEKGSNVFKTHATKGTYRIRENGQERSRPVPAADLANQHSNSFLWSEWENPDDAGRRYFLSVNLDYYQNVDLDDIDGTVTDEMVDKFHVEN